MEKISKIIRLMSPEFAASYLLSFLIMIFFVYLFTGAHASGNNEAEAFWAVLGGIAATAFVIMTITLIWFALIEWFKKISKNY